MIDHFWEFVWDFSFFLNLVRRMDQSDANEDWMSATCNYGENFIASIKKGNIHAVQFHPEKSGVVGLAILERFLHSRSSLVKMKRETKRKASKLAKRVIACLDVRTNDTEILL
ncbi:hypothetical protein Scep_028417 [Stephania cephalantha]|uniref:Imidazole glycerol phosphate synthase subunit HisH n=1 Tax=Stephania cephalantha TaxID=152367 RepID=A0AAP0E9W3_9MAGN